MDVVVEFKYGFNKKVPEGAKLAKAQGYDIEASYKDLCEVCADIRGTLAEPALTHLTHAAEGAIPIRFHKFARHLGHRRELGGKRGRFPMKAAEYVRRILENAIANANAKGIKTPFILHAAANKQRTIPRIAPKGRRNRNDYETARIEIVISEAVAERSEIADRQPRELKVKMQAQKTAEKMEKAKQEKAKVTV